MAGQSGTIEDVYTTQVMDNANQLTSIASNMQAILEETTGLMKNVGNGDQVWYSEAAQNFRQKYDTLSKRFELFVGDVNAYANFLKTSVVGGYEEADKMAQQAAEDLAS